MNYIKITTTDITNGPGFRTVLWTAGCSHKCPGCHNPETHDFLAGKEFTGDTLQTLLDECDKPYIAGLTLTGGDPVDSWEDIVPVIKAFRERFGTSKTIWLWTGYNMDELMKKGIDIQLLDVVVEGRFVLAKRDITLAWRGSTNQRIWVNCGGYYYDQTQWFDSQNA